MQLLKRKKIVQFGLIVYSLNHGCPMTKYYNAKIICANECFNNPKKHWSNGVSWKMTNLV
jgi:hypothetical protein